MADILENSLLNRECPKCNGWDDHWSGGWPVQPVDGRTPLGSIRPGLWTGNQMYSQVNKGPARMARSQDLGKNSSLQFRRAVLDVQVLDIRFTGCCQLVREQTSAHTHVRHYDSPLDQISKTHSSTFMIPLLFFSANKFILVYTSYLFHLIKNCL